MQRRAVEHVNPKPEGSLMVEFDQIFNYIGQFGVFQFCTFILVGISSLVVGMQNISSTFLGGEMEHWCEIPRLNNFR